MTITAASHSSDAIIQQQLREPQIRAARTVPGVPDRVLIVGADGLVARALRRSLSDEGCTVVALGRQALDITDAEAVQRACDDVRPRLIINGAVLGVDASERDPERAAAVNTAGPANLARVAQALGGELLHFSTNYVFDGTRLGGAPYTQSDEARPLNRYGQSKLAGEFSIQDACSRAFVVRTSWVFGPAKVGFVNETRRRLDAGERVHAIADVWANTTYVADLVARALQIVRLGRHGTYHVVNSGVCSYFEIAWEVGRHWGLSDAALSELIVRSVAPDAGWLAPRPRFTPMRCLASEELGLLPMRDWRDALQDFLRAAPAPP